MSISFFSDYEKFARTWQVQASLQVQFYLKYSPNVFSPSNLDISEISKNQRALLVIDENVYQLYSKRIHAYYSHFDIDLFILRLDCSEATKDWDQVSAILQFFEDHKVLRRETIFCIGGGVLLDIAGFACSLFRRGIPFVKVPTTLLAIVDASVGSKVGINHFGRRNRLGAYYPPVATLIDRTFVKTESQRNITNGIGEIFKLSLVKSIELFQLLESEAELLIREKFQYGAVPVRVINLAISEMIEELAPNLWEKNLRRSVDFGHTFSPIPEMMYSDDILHGEAVALDCLLSSCISYNRSFISHVDIKRIFALARSLSLPLYHKSFDDSGLLYQSLLDARLHRDGFQNLPIPYSIGNHKFINDLTHDELQLAILVMKDLST